MCVLLYCMWGCVCACVCMCMCVCVCVCYCTVRGVVCVRVCVMKTCLRRQCSSSQNCAIQPYGSATVGGPHGVFVLMCVYLYLVMNKFAPTLPAFSTHTHKHTHTHTQIHECKYTHPNSPQCSACTNTNTHTHAHTRSVVLLHRTGACQHTLRPPLTQLHTGDPR